MMWCVTLPNASIHSFDQLVRELTNGFYQYDHQALKKKILKLRKALYESLVQFWDLFHNLAFQILEDEIYWKFLNEIF